MKCLRIISLALLFSVLGCSSQRVPVVGSYYLEKFSENGRFYMRQPGDRSNGGVFDGYLLYIGANEDVVIAYVKRLYRGDPDGWYTLDVKTGKVSRPLSESERNKLCNKNGIACESVDAIWARKKIVAQ